MSNKVNPIPPGYHTITPYLIVDDGANAIEFYKKAFGAKEIMRFGKPDGKIGHAEMQLGDSKFMLGDACPQMGASSPKTYKGSPISIHLYVEDVDNFVAKAVEAGTTLVRPVEDMFYGDRAGALEDPFGHTWYVATHVEDVTDEEIRQRSKKLFGEK